jgi:large subunit ribosomal protein L18
MRTEKKLRLTRTRRWRIRKKVVGTNERPRMSVRFTGKNIHIQFIDDDARRTLVATSTVGNAPDRQNLSANVASAQLLGKQAAELAQGKGIKKVVFDRSGSRYHGKVKALADAAREAGLQF